jgi:hypothetical protein
MRYKSTGLYCLERTAHSELKGIHRCGRRMPIVEGDVCLSLMPDLLINDVQFQAGGCGIELGRLDKRLRGVWQDSNNVGSLRAKVGCAEIRRKGFHPLD